MVSPKKRPFGMLTMVRTIHQPSYEFYYPYVAARQLGFGQLPVHLFFTDLVKPRETVSNGLEYDRLKNLVLDADTIDLEGWIISSFTTKHTAKTLPASMVVGMESPSLLR
jgi:hypothetical protein